jgi:hypothetical protein
VEAGANCRRWARTHTPPVKRSTRSTLVARWHLGDPVYAKGVQYLLDTQAADGSWHVNSRSIWLQPYFESGFSYGTDQWISAVGTSWAAIALSLTVDARSATRDTQLASNRRGR